MEQRRHQTGEAVNDSYWINRNNELREVIFRKSDKTIIMEMFHDNKGHLGIEKTYNAISEIYYWKNVYSDVSNHIKSCPKCQHCGYLKKTDDVLHPIPIVAPWYHVGIDLVKMPKSKSGNSYILSLVDYFTKWPEAIAIPDKKAETIASSLYKIFLIMGFPAIYSSDQGREFVNSVMSSLIEKTNAVHRISTAYHPQTNGLVERFNQTIQQMILKICNEDQNDWDIFLPELLFSYRTMVHKTTKQTPFSVMFGRPFSGIEQPSIDLNNNNESDYEGGLKFITDLRESVISTVKKMLPNHRKNRKNNMQRKEKWIRSQTK
jgi:hypothetical protein